MITTNYKRIYAIKKENEKRILKVCPNVPHRSGIYFLLREENGFKFAYIGQAVDLLRRLADHLSGYQHIDLSIKKHGLYSEDNPNGYKINFLEFPKEQLNEKEMYFIRKYANAGYQLRNSTSGSQGEGKTGLDNAKQPRTYTEGLHNGYKNAQKEIKHLFDLHLDVVPKKSPPTKLQEKALQKFKDFINGSESDNE